MDFRGVVFGFDDEIDASSVRALGGDRLRGFAKAPFQTSLAGDS